MQLPDQYAWLASEPAPRMLLEFLKIYGVAEKQGAEDNPEILAWAKECGLEKQYVHDITPWCGLEMAVIALRAGKVVPAGPLWALNWTNFGTPVSLEDGPMLGDVLIFKRPGGGHVGMYVGQDETAYHTAGGNEGDKSTIIRIAKNRLYAIRRPVYNTGMPPNVRKVLLKPSGLISADEK